ncbi:hypothetical protein GUY59_19140 [Nonomuraea sp. K271]|nr:hypothetical protein [Nonomuraea sp. K271]
MDGLGATAQITGHPVGVERLPEVVDRLLAPATAPVCLGEMAEGDGGADRVADIAGDGQ